MHRLKLALNWTGPAVLGCVLAVFAAGFFDAFSRYSLWTDEVVSVEMFSSRGPLHVLTNYPIANNHLFYNALNSLVPGIESLEPFRVRFLSFLAVTGAALGGAVYFGWRRREPFAAGVILFALLGTQMFLHLNLQARGYGLLAFFTVALIAATLETLASRERLPLVALGLVTVLGTWTIPFFVFYAGLVLLLLFAVTRRRDVFVTGALTVAAIFLVHLPVLGAILKAREEYQYGQFGDIQAVFNVLNGYLLQGLPAALQFGLFLAFVISPWLFRNGTREDFQSPGFVLGVPVLLAFGIALVMEAPIERTCSFLVIPFSLVLWWGLERAASRIHPEWGGLVAGTVLTLALALFVPTRPLSLLDAPVEAWQDSARLIIATYPEGVGFATDPADDPGRLSAYLDAARYPHRPSLDPAAVGRGEAVLVEWNLGVPASDRVAWPAGSGVRTVTFPQLRNDSQRLSFRPPASGRVTVTSAEPKPGTTSRQNFVLDLELPATPEGRERPKRLAIWSSLAKPVETGRPKIRHWEEEREKWSREVHSTGPCLDKIWFLDLADHPGSRIRLSYYLDTPSPDIPDLEAWVLY